MNTIDGFQDFFDRHRYFEQAIDSRLATFFGRVRSELPSLLECLRQEEMLFAPRFNIFRVLDIERKEDVLHTPMLAHLLDPSSQHAQGAVFLKIFFETIRQYSDDVPDASSLQGGHWIVRPEFYIGSGSVVDILIENARKKFVVLVENKIDTDDHNDQIPRYCTWLENHRRGYKWRLLIYLTPDGRNPISSKGCKFLPLSYRKDIVGFLTTALQKVEAEPVREVVRQYRAILKDRMDEDDDDQTS
jgi:hypothetical protein